MSRYLSERRRFLKLVGASALTYPFLRGVPSYAAGSDAGTEPMYLVLLYTSCGCVRPLWGAYGPPATGASAVVTPLSASAGDGGVGGFRPTLSAFQQKGLTDQVIVLDGLNNAAANGGTHEAGMASLWTASTIVNGSNASGPSIDQVIGQQLVAQGVMPSTSLNAANLYAVSACDEQTRGVHNRMLYGTPSGAAQPAPYVDPITTPSAALGSLFPTATKAVGPDPTLQIRQQVQKQVNSEIGSLASRLCTEDRIQLQSLQSMWNQADSDLAAAAAAASSCMQPAAFTQPAGDPFQAPSACVSNDPFPQNISAMSNILAMSLACDLTRVASFQLSQALSPTQHTWLNASLPASAQQTSTHHVFSHMGPASFGPLIPNCGNPGPNYCGPDPLYSISPAEVYQNNMYPQQLGAIDAWYAEQVAAFAYSLSQLKTKTGKNLLDQTIICWGSELDMGAYHNHDDTPFLLVGGKGSGKLKTGQLVRFPLNLTADYYNQGNKPPTNNRFHNDLLATLAHVMGVSVPGGTFGTTSVPGTNFGATGSLTLNQGLINEILT